MHSKAFITFRISFLVAVLAGCKTADHPKSDGNANAVHVAVLSIARYDDIKAELQPTFKIEPEDALKMAIPISAILTRSMTDTNDFGLSAGGTPPSAAPSTEANAGSKNSSTGPAAAASAPSGSPVTLIVGGQSITVTQAPKAAAEPSPTPTPAPTPAASSTSSPTEPKGSATGGGSAKTVTPTPTTAESAAAKQGASKGSTPSQEIAVDPMMQYRAASALFEEIKLINHSIADAPKIPGYTAYVVRIQITLMPSTRNEAYDALTNLSFFLGKDPNSNETESFHAIAATDQATRQSDSSYAKGVFLRDTGLSVPVVIPLLVTDSIDSTLSSQTAQAIREFALAISGPKSVGSPGLSYKQAHDLIDQYVGRQLNSLMTVGRVNENTFRVRLGAVQKSDNDFVMVAQTHCVTVLLLVDDKPRVHSINMVARTTFIDAKGVEHSTVADHNWKTDLAAEGDKYQWTESLAENDVRDLMFWARDGNYPVFVEELHAITSSEEYIKHFIQFRVKADAKRGRPSDPSDIENYDVVRLPYEVLDDERQLWADLILINSGSPYSFVEFDLPDSTTQGAEDGQRTLEPSPSPTPAPSPTPTPSSPAGK